MGNATLIISVFVVHLNRSCRQNPVECIFSFICSSNNNIPRITGMLGNLRRTYGDLLLSVGEGGLAATGAFGNIMVMTVPPGIFCPRGPLVVFCSVPLNTSAHHCRACENAATITWRPSHQTVTVCHTPSSLARAHSCFRGAKTGRSSPWSCIRFQRWTHSLRAQRRLIYERWVSTRLNAPQHKYVYIYCGPPPRWNGSHVVHVSTRTITSTVFACAVSAWHVFVGPRPIVFALCVVVATKLSGFGYRAKYIVESAKLMHSKGGEDWALDMRSKGRAEVRAQLITLCGVGPKVRKASVSAV